MNEELKRILTMVENGKLTSEQAATLIDSFDKGSEAINESKETTYLNKLLKVRVHSEHNDNINVNVPIRLVKVLLQTGLGIAATIPQANAYTEGIDVNLLVEAIDQELVGQIVDATLANGDTIQVFVE